MTAAFAKAAQNTVEILRQAYLGCQVGTLAYVTAYYAYLDGDTRLVATKLRSYPTIGEVARQDGA